MVQQGEQRSPSPKPPKSNNNSNTFLNRILRTPSPPPSISSHSGPYYFRSIPHTHTDHESAHGTTSLPAGWASAIATSIVHPAPVLPASFSSPSVPQVPPAKEAAIEEYYQNIGLDFKCLDQEDVFNDADDHLMGRACKNMVVDFGEKSSWVGCDVPEEDTIKLMDSWDSGEKPKEVNTRWMYVV